MVSGENPLLGALNSAKYAEKIIIIITENFICIDNNLSLKRYLLSCMVYLQKWRTWDSSKFYF